MRLLLKYDWDRSRCEIMGISKRKISDNYVSSVALYSASLSGKGQVFSRIFKGTNWSRKSIRNYALSLSTEEKKKKARHRNAIIYAILVILLFILAVVVTILAISSHFSYVGYYMTALLFAVPSIVLGTLVTYFTREKIIFSMIVEAWCFLAICVLISSIPGFDWHSVPINAYGLAVCVSTLPFIVRGFFYTK